MDIVLMISVCIVGLIPVYSIVKEIPKRKYKR
jgi:hypothetical protein